jgi:glycine C-acetyltransferase/8-amino-7-oxononanoate synthase
VIGEASSTMELCERILASGVFAQGIRPPTVPEGTSRLRLSVMANHRADELVGAAAAIGRAARSLGIVPGEQRRAASVSSLPRAA